MEYKFLVSKIAELAIDIFEKYKIEIDKPLPNIDVAILGEFSVGKTALLNALLGTEQLFKESMSRETKIATKVRYTPESNHYTIEYKQQGNKTSSKFPFTMPFDTKKFGEDVKVANVYLNSKAMLSYHQAKLYFTDLPGTNSGNPFHDAVINDTILHSHVLLLCVPSDTGNISDGLFRKLLDIKKANENMLIIGVITKASLSNDNGKSICNLLEKTLMEKIHRSKLIKCVTTDALDGDVEQLKSALLKSYGLYHFRLLIPIILKKLFFDIQKNVTIDDVFDMMKKIIETAETRKLKN